VRFALPGRVAIATMDPGNGGVRCPNRRVVAVKTLKFWASPAVLVALWILAAAFTLSQLATVAPSFLSTRVELPPLEETRDLGA
jgi:hypothetical protein